MANQDSRIVVSRTINAPAKEIFDLLTLPARHAEFDGSGFIVSDDKTQRLQGVGDVFTMNMHGDHMDGDYKTDNHVITFSANKQIGWATAPAGEEPPGWTWVYELKADGAHATEVTLTYDWEAVTDKELLPLFPLVGEDELENSLARLAEAVAGA